MPVLTVSGWRRHGSPAKYIRHGTRSEGICTPKTEYTAANILDMGGLVSGAAGLLSSGASAIGLDGVAKALDFDTSDIAKLIDKGVGIQSLRLSLSLMLLG